MYLFEWGIWSIRSESPEKKAHEEAQIEKAFGPSYMKEFLGPEPQDDDAGVEWGPDNRASEQPSDADAFYEINDIFIEARAAWQEEKRGFITFLTLGFGYGIGVLFFGWVYWQLLRLTLYGETTGGRTADDVGAWLLLSFFGLVGIGVGYLVWKYAFKFIRTELFTQRHLLIRFNRETRQVYLHRPKYAGGIVVLPWEATVAAINPDLPDSQGMGDSLALGWPTERTDAGYDEMAFVGPPLDGNREMEGLWEYIRRYMEEGPQSVPKPKSLRARIPWPWDSLKASLHFMRPMWRRGGGVWVVLMLVLLSPLILLHSASHWVSMLLCWRPRWPREIREAGQPGKPVPKLTVAEDFGPEIGQYLRANAERNSTRTRARIAQRTGRRKEATA